MKFLTGDVLAFETRVGDFSRSLVPLKTRHSETTEITQRFSDQGPDAGALDMAQPVKEVFDLRVEIAGLCGKFGCPGLNIGCGISGLLGRVAHNPDRG